MRKQYVWFAGSMAVFVGLPLVAVAADSLEQAMSVVLLVLIAAVAVGILAVRAAMVGMFAGLTALLIALLVMATTTQPPYCGQGSYCGGDGPLVASIWFLLTVLTVFAFGLGRLTRWISDRRAPSERAR